MGAMAQAGGNIGAKRRLVPRAFIKGVLME